MVYYPAVYGRCEAIAWKIDWKGRTVVCVPVCMCVNANCVVEDGKFFLLIDHLRSK